MNRWHPCKNCGTMTQRRGEVCSACIEAAKTKKERNSRDYSKEDFNPKGCCDPYYGSAE